VDKAIERGWEVHALVRKTGNMRWIKGKKIRIHHGDVRNSASLEKAFKTTAFDYVIHCAAALYSHHRETFRSVNVGGTEKMLSACIETNPDIKSFVLVSSLAACGPAGTLSPLEENAPFHPVTEYGRSKEEAEKKALYFSQFLPLTIIRPPAVYGPRDRAFLPVFRLAASGFLLYPAGRPRYASLVHVEDLAEGIIQAAEKQRESTIHDGYATGGGKQFSEKGSPKRPFSSTSPETGIHSLNADAAYDPTDPRWYQNGALPGENIPLSANGARNPLDDDVPFEGLLSVPVYFISHTEYLSWLELGDIIASIRGRKPMKIPLPMQVALTAAFLSETAMKLLNRPFPLTHEKVVDLYQHYWICSPARAMKALGFHPRSLSEGIRETMQWYRKWGWL
jgi:nucleoside-diphosphate-sugar epimerase